MAVSSPLISFVLRGFQALFAIIVLGLSITLIRGHHWGGLPAVLGFSAFVGGLSFLAAIIGLAATWLSFLEGIVGLIIDGVVAVLNIAGGIFMAIKLNGVKCSKNLFDLYNLHKLGTNSMFNSGCDEDGNCWLDNQYETTDEILDVLVGHCREAQADTVFMFLTAVVLLVCGVFVFLRMRKGY